MPIESKKSSKLLKRGRHSVVYLIGKYAIKVFDEKYRYNFKKEVKFLTLLQPFDFVPKIYYVDTDNQKIVMERIYGEILPNAVSRENVKKCLEICFILDMIGIQKEEMSRPEKHILIQGDRVVFIDFERGVLTDKPSNVSQFCAYIKKFGFNIPTELIRRYKKHPRKDLFLEILKFVELKNK